LLSADGIFFDNQERGEFIYLKPINSTSKPGLELQVRQTSWFSTGAAVISAVAIRARNRVFQIELDKPLLVDGKPFTQSNMLIDGDVAMQRFADGTYRIQYGNELIEIQLRRNKFINIFGGVTKDNRYHGMVGTPNNNRADDFVTPDGTLLNVSMQYELAQAWMVTRSNSLFTYDPGKGPESYRSSVPFTRPSPQTLQPFAQQVLADINASACSYPQANILDDFIQNAAMDIYLGFPRESVLTASCRYQISGLVVNRQNSNSPAVGHVVAMQAPGLTPCTTFTDNAGAFVCVMLPISSSQSIPVPVVTIDVAGAQAITRAFASKALLMQTAVITDVGVAVPLNTLNVGGRLTRADGSPVVNRSVSISVREPGRDADFVQTVNTDADGRYVARITTPDVVASLSGRAEIDYNGARIAQPINVALAAGQTVTQVVNFEQLANLGTVLFAGRITNTVPTGPTPEQLSVRIESPGIAGGACQAMWVWESYSCRAAVVSAQAFTGNIVVRGIVAGDIYTVPFSIAANEIPVGGDMLVKQNDVVGTFRNTAPGVMRFTGQIANTAAGGPSVYGLLVRVESTGIAEGFCETFSNAWGYSCLAAVTSNEAFAGNVIVRGIGANEVYTAPFSVAAGEIPPAGGSADKRIDVSGLFQSRSVFVSVRPFNAYVPADVGNILYNGGGSIEVSSDAGVLCQTALTALDNRCRFNTVITGPLSLRVTVTSAYGSGTQVTQTIIGQDNNQYLSVKVPITPTTVVVTGLVTQFGTLPMPSAYVEVRPDTPDIVDVSTVGADANGVYTSYVTLKQNVSAINLSAFVDYDSFYERYPSPEATTLSLPASNLAANRVTTFTLNHNFTQRTVKFEVSEVVNGHQNANGYSGRLLANSLQINVGSQTLCAAVGVEWGIRCTMLLTSAAPIQTTLVVTGSWGATSRPFMLDPLQVPGTAAVDGQRLEITALPTMVRLTGQVLRNGVPVPYAYVYVTRAGIGAPFDDRVFLDRADNNGFIDAWIPIRGGASAGQIQLQVYSESFPLPLNRDVVVNVSGLAIGQVNTDSQTITVP
jgi:hypothetical protein